jgi:hypothetical protein
LAGVDRIDSEREGREMQITNTAAVAASAIEGQSAVSVATQNVSYSANVGGKTYAADISVSAGEYVASVPNMAPPVSVTGSSLTAAENNLSARIDFLV